MNNYPEAWPWPWRRFVVDVLIGASTVAVAFATLDTASDVRSILLVACASLLIALGLVVEPHAAAEPARDIYHSPTPASA